MYPTDVSEEKWSLVEDLFERPDPRGKKSLHEKRVLFNAMLYVVKTGCQWRMLPKDLPPWPAVYSAYRRWTESGLFEAALKRLNIAYRQQLNRHESPSLGILDSQSTKTANVAELKGFDGHKKNKGTQKTHRR